MKRAQIVLIEDNRGDVTLIELALRENGIDFALTHFTTGVEAVGVLSGQSNDEVVHPDLILLDLNTPRSDGFETLVALQQNPRFARVPIAILTSSRARSDKHRAAMRGVRYIEKPVELNDFLVSVGGAVKEMLSAPTAKSAAAEHRSSIGSEKSDVA